MRSFNRFYLWGVRMKYHMGIYTVAGVFFQAIINALQGIYTVDSLTMLEMLAVSVIFASSETAIFPSGMKWGKAGGVQPFGLLWPMWCISAAPWALAGSGESRCGAASC